MTDAQADEPTPEEAAKLAELHAELDKRIAANADGSFVLHLFKPIRGGKLDRITMRPIRVADLRVVRDEPPDRRLEAYASRIASPKGAVDELETDFDFTMALRATGKALDRYLDSGPSSSP